MSFTVRMMTMLRTIVLILIFSRAGVGVDMKAPQKIACGTFLFLTCTDLDGFVPTWFRNGMAIVGDDYSYIKDENSGAVTGRVILNGSDLCGTTSFIYCATRYRGNLHNTTLIIEGPLPSPEKVNLKKLNNSSIDINWKPPYSTRNNGSHIMQVDPRITQYTVYTIDNKTGDTVHVVNVTKTHYTIRSNASDDGSCPIYHVTAWNSGGEGGMSGPVYPPQVPHKIATEDVVLTMLTESEVLQIHLHCVFNTCALRSPSYFLVTWNTTAGLDSRTEYHHCPVNDIRIRLPKNVEKCNLVITITAGNSVGMSSPTMFTIRCEATGHSTVTTVVEVTPTKTKGPISTNLVVAQGDYSKIYIAFGIAIGVVVAILATVASILIILWRCKRPTNVKSESATRPFHQPDSHLGPEYSTLPCVRPTVGSRCADVEPPQGKPELPPPKERMDDTPIEVQEQTRSDSACYIGNQMVPQYPSTPPTYAKNHKEDTLDGEEKENAKQCNTFD